MKRRRIELRLISELMKNSRKSDRDLAKIIGVSQPTITRLRTKLEKEGYIREYTCIPDFRKLGFEIAAINFFNFTKDSSKEEIAEVRKWTKKTREQNPVAALLALRGIGIGCNRAYVTLHEDYASYLKVLNLTKQIPSVDVSHVESFIVSLTEKDQYLPVTLSMIANYLLTMEKTKNDVHLKD